MGNKQTPQQLHDHHAQNENKYDGDDLFDSQKQETFRQLFDEQIVTTQTTLTSPQLVNWITTYLKEEKYEDIDAIQQDLNDPQFSHLKQTMEDQLQNEANPQTVQTICTILKEDVFILNDDAYVPSHRDSISTNMDMSETHDEEEAKYTYDNRPSVIEHHDQPSRTDENVMWDGAFGLLQRKSERAERPPDFFKQKTLNVQEIKVIEDQYTANKEPFPEFINVALFGRSDDEYLEMLIDQALKTVCYNKKLEPLWNDRSFITKIYNNHQFPDAVETVYNKINHDDHKDDLDFIGKFVRKEFKRQINENKRKIEEKALEDTTEEEKTNDFGDTYNVYYDDEQKEYRMERMETLRRRGSRRATLLNQEHHALFTVQLAEDNDAFCWSVFKKKRYKNNYGIKTKGFWEIITAEKDRQRETKRRQSEEQVNLARSQMAKTKPNSTFNFLQKTKTAFKHLSHRVLSIAEEEGKSTSKIQFATTLTVPPDSPKDLESHDANTPDTDDAKSPLSPTTKKKKTFPYISLSHLNVIFELVQFHYIHSIKEAKEKQSIVRKEQKLIESPLYDYYCAPQNFAKSRRKSRFQKQDEFQIQIDNRVYKLQWWNMKGRAECNAFSIYVGTKQCFYMRFKHRYAKEEKGIQINRMIWDWYDNDHAKYRRYHPGENQAVYKELEASFQSNVDANFPYHVFGLNTDTRILIPEKADHKHERMFSICILPELKKFLKTYKKLNIECMVLRFTFTEKTNRILNIEQVSLRQTGSFPRNVRRLLDQRNSLSFYWQNTNKFIEEWKYRYLLSTKQQQLYFWSYILCIATIMKYIEIEKSHQMISIPFEREDVKQEVAYTGLDDSDLQRHIIDYKLWDGFFMPPQNQLQTAQISKTMDMSATDDFEGWYTSLSRVAPFSKFVNDADQRTSLTISKTEGGITCGHAIKTGDILWYSKQTYDVYCNRCATLLQFSECIRKYVLESESQEVIDFLWPWYRNYDHRTDRKKYLKYIAKYNLSHLFMVRDVVGKHAHVKNDINLDDDDLEADSCWKGLCCCSSARNEFNLDQLQTSPLLNQRKAYRDKDDELDGKQIRHLRKFAALVLLQPWDILRNINVLKTQLQLLFKLEDLQQKIADEGMKTWKDWKEEIHIINGKTQKQILGSDRKTILELRHDAEFNLSDKEQNVVHGLVESILEDFTEKEHKEREAQTSDDQKRYYWSFKDSFRRTPKWWSTEHDILLMELSLKFNWNGDEINDELTDPSNKYYYQELLKSKKIKEIKEEKDVKEVVDPWLSSTNFSDGNIDDDGGFQVDEDKDEEKEKQMAEKRMSERLNTDDFEYRGYQEFQVWCSDWRNIQHRLRFLSFTVCKYLNRCKPSIIEIRIPNRSDRSKQYSTESFIFLSGYVEKVHLGNCEPKRVQKKTLQDMMRKNKRIRSMHNVLSAKTLHKAQISQIIEQEANKARMRDPFMTRDLDFELEQICQSYDLLQHGVDIATLLIELLARKQSDSLWKALGIVLEYMPYEKARFVLSQKRGALRHGEPQQLKNVCDRIIKGSNFSVHICLFLAEYMEKNAEQDLARFKKWMEFSQYYEEEAGKTINDIESDHLLSVLMDIPLSESGKEKVPLLQVALEQNRAEFLNNERINAVLKHVWQTPSGLDPTVDILSNSQNSQEIVHLLADSPFHFYLTPMGFNSTIKSLHLLYLLSIFVFISNRIYLDDPLEKFEMFLWTLNIGYFVYEIIEAYDKGLRDYFTLAGWVNYWDLQISFTWLSLFGIRLLSTVLDSDDFVEQWSLSEIYLVLWAIETASLSGRSLVLFQTSEYFGVLLRMMQRLIVEMLRFMFVLALILVGFVFGLYYIEGGYDDTGLSASDWFEGFKYLFQLTVGAGDFNEIHDIVENGLIAQLYVILYIVFATILMMNLLIALMTTTYEDIHRQAKTESSFAIAEITFDLSHRSRFMPAPICIYIFAIAAVIHILNFIPAILCPQSGNIYNYINHRRYQWLVHFKISNANCRCCCRKHKEPPPVQTEKELEVGDNDSVTKKSKRRCWCCRNDSSEDDDEDVYILSKRGRVFRYYGSTICCCFQKTFKSHKYNIHHPGCYSCIPTELGAKDKEDKDRSSCNGITLNQYAEQYERHFKFALDPADTVLLKHLTVDTLFCKYCYRPFDPKNHLNDLLLTPFWALSEMISIYLFPFTVWIPLLIVYGMLSLFESIGSVFNNEITEPPNVPEYDRQYFQKETLKISNSSKSSLNKPQINTDNVSNDD